MENSGKDALIYEMSLHIGKLTLEVEQLRAQVAHLKKTKAEHSEPQLEPESCSSSSNSSSNSKGKSLARVGRDVLLGRIEPKSDAAVKTMVIKSECSNNNGCDNAKSPTAWERRITRVVDVDLSQRPVSESVDDTSNAQAVAITRVAASAFHSKGGSADDKENGGAPDAEAKGFSQVAGEGRKETEHNNGGHGSPLGRSRKAEAQVASGPGNNDQIEALVSKYLGQVSTEENEEEEAVQEGDEQGKGRTPVHHCSGDEGLLDESPESSSLCTSRGSYRPDYSDDDNDNEDENVDEDEDEDEDDDSSSDEFFLDQIQRRYMQPTGNVRHTIFTNLVDQ